MKNIGLILTLSVAVCAPLAAASATSVSESVQVAAAAAPSAVRVGKMLYSADGKKLAAVYKVDSSGAPQILLDGKMLTVPASTLSEVDGKFATSLTKKELFTR